jgi:hypothetical protein
MAALWKEMNKKEPGGERIRDDEGKFIQSPPRGGERCESEKAIPDKCSPKFCSRWTIVQISIFGKFQKYNLLRDTQNSSTR